VAGLEEEVKKQAQMAVWFLLLVHFNLHHYPSFKHREKLYHKAGVTSYQVCSPETELVQVPNDQTWKAIAILENDKSVTKARVSIEGTCN
jgi:hypothetical protein